MDRELIQDYLQLAEMNKAQAEALSRIFAEMATKSDLRILEEKLTGQMVNLETRLTGQMGQLRAELTGQMAQLETKLTWRMIAVVGFFATAMTLLNRILG